MPNAAAHPKPSRTFAEFGIHLTAGASGEVRTTCPQCSASRRKSQDPCMAVNADEGVWHCWHCGWRGTLKSGGTVARTIPDMAAPPRTPDEKKQAAIQKNWRDAQPVVEGDPVHRYLHNRGITLPLTDIPTAIRYHTRLAYQYDDGHFDYHPAMISRIDDPQGQMVSLHRTYLTADGHKADVPKVKKIMSCALRSASSGGAVRLYPAAEVLCIAEGIETALAVRLLTGRAVWAAISATGMANIVLPYTVVHVAICADHDLPSKEHPSGAGQEAAAQLQTRMRRELRHASVHLPERPGTDWVDSLKE